MIKSDIQVTEKATNLPPLKLCTSANSDLLSGQTKIEHPVSENISERMQVKSPFARVKRRLRCRASSIF